MPPRRNDLSHGDEIASLLDELRTLQAEITTRQDRRTELVRSVRAYAGPRQNNRVPGTSYRDLGELLGVTASTVRRWDVGSHPGEAASAHPTSRFRPRSSAPVLALAAAGSLLRSYVAPAPADDEVHEVVDAGSYDGRQRRWRVVCSCGWQHWQSDPYSDEHGLSLQDYLAGHLDR